MPERKTLSEDLFYRGSSANLRRLHTCKNKKSRFGILANLPSQDECATLSNLWTYTLQVCVFGHNAIEATKNICCVKGEGAVNYSNQMVCKNIDD